MNDNTKVCKIKGCNNKTYARNYCSKHYRIYVRKTKCKIDGCNSFVDSRGYCNMHYERWRRHGDPLKVISRKVVGKCKVESCKNDIYCRGYCVRHYQRFMKYGDPSRSVRNTNVPEHCTVKECTRKHFALGYCKKHYTRYKRYGSPYTLRAKPNIIADKCKIDSCDQKHFGRGYCKYHYYRSDYHKQKSHKYRARKMNAPINDFDKSMIKEVMKYFENRCGYCGVKLKDYHIEHVIPLSRGGSHTKSNIIVSCPSCNYDKNTKRLEEWYPQQPFYNRKREDRILRWMGHKVYDNKIQLKLF